MMIKYILPMVLIPLCCAALQPYTPEGVDVVLEPWRWQHMSVLDGAGVLCMDEAPKGTLWFGATGCLVRYDSYEAKRIPFDDTLLERISRGRAQSLAYTVLALADDELLAVVDNSLVRWTRGEWSVVVDKLESSSLNAQLFKTHDGGIWLQTRHVLWRIHDDLSGGREVIRVPDAERLASCAGSGAEIWVLKSAENLADELIRIPLDGGQVAAQLQWTRFPGAGYSGLRHVRLLAVANGMIWLADNVATHTLQRFDIVNERWSAPELGVEKKTFHSLIERQDGTVLAGGKGELAAIHSLNASFYTASQLDLPDVPLVLFKAADGMIWIIAEFDQVFRLDLNAERWRSVAGLHFQCDSEDGQMQWFLTETKRIVSHDLRTGEWLRHDVSDGAIRWPLILKTSSHGLIWAVGSNSSGEGGRAAFSIYDGASWKRHSLPEFCDKIYPGAVLEAKDGTMWFGGWVSMSSCFQGGLLQYRVTDSGNVELLKHHERPLIPRRISFVAQSAPNEFWMGDESTYRYDVGQQDVTESEDLPLREILDMTVDSDEKIWIAKGGGGLFRKRNGTWRRYSTDDGLAGSVVSDLLPLQDGSLLASTRKGISRFDGRSWTRFAYPDSISVSGIGATMKEATDGSVWFNLNTPIRSEEDGALGVFSVNYVADTDPPDTMISFYQENVAQPGNSQISWEGRDRWGHTPKEQLEYSWRLNEEEWSSYSQETGRMFPVLEHGRHRFEVRARDIDFNVDPTPASIEFIVEAPLWMQSWFITMVLLFVGGTTAFILMMIYFHDKRLKDRSRHLEEIDQMKTSFFINISHELNTPLTLIREPLKRMLKSAKEESDKKRLSMAIWNAERVATLVSQLLDFRRLESGKLQLNLEQGNIVEHVQYTMNSLMPLAEMHQVALRLEGVDACIGRFDPDKLGKILHNLAGNAIKYTPAQGVVRIILQEMNDGQRGRILLLVVEDTGYGIPPEHLEHIFERFYRVPEKSIVDGSGIGLNLAREMVELWGGSIRAESPIHADAEYPGTRFIVNLPIDAEAGSNA